MAITEVYVDPSIAANTGTGTIGDPYGDLEYAIVQTTFDTTNGTRVNIKAGTAEVTAADLMTSINDTSVSVAWVPGNSAPLIFQGYTSVAGDGGVGAVTGGGGAYGFVVDATATIDYVHFIDLHLYNFGAGCIRVDNGSVVARCHIENITGNAIQTDLDSFIIGNYVHNCTAQGILCAEATVCYNYLDHDGGGMTVGIQTSSGGSAVFGNIVIVDGDGYGINAWNAANVLNNSIYCDSSGTGVGIDCAGTQFATVLNNIVEGFSGVGGVGIRNNDADVVMSVYGGNAVYDCTTAYAITPSTMLDLGDNETLTASAFNDAANGDFSPVDTGNVKEGALPNSIGGGFV